MPVSNPGKIKRRVKIKGSVLPIAMLAVSSCLAAGETIQTGDSGKVLKPVFTAYTEAGTNNVSDGFFLRTAGFGNFRIGNLSAEGGLLTNLKNRNEKFLSAASVTGSWSFRTKYKFQMAVGLFAKWSFPGSIIRLSDMGLLTDIRYPRFSATIGTNFKKYRLSGKASEEFDPLYETGISENWNLVYSFRYMVKKNGNTWNIGAGVTNTDYFVVSQPTNPALYLNGYYNVTARFRIFGEARYICAGAMNTNVNHFGTLVRGGIKWNLGDTW